MIDRVVGESTALFQSPHVDRFDEWLHAPAPLESMHPQFEIRRALPAEFDRIYDLVDDAFGVKRSRLQYDWLYRRNPFGTARCWMVSDRASGQLVGSSASWPWPFARGAHRLEGTQDGDTVVASRWQRRGIDGLRSAVWRSHAWFTSAITLSWPNEITRRAGIKRGRAAEIAGPVPRAMLMLNAKAFLAERHWPAFATVPVGAALDVALAALRKIRSRDHRGFAIGAVRRFDSGANEVARRCMTWPGLWSPHDAEFLNWRYLEHPTAQYLAFAAEAGGELAGYYVLKIDGQASWLMEFVSPVSPTPLASALLLHLIGAARAAGSTHLIFSAPPGWRHWKLFRAVGFFSVSSGIYIWPTGGEPDLTNLTAWQWVPGDMDYL